MEDLIIKMNPWWKKKYNPKGIRRSKYLRLLENHLDHKNVVLITGLRRIGKTTIMKQFISDLIESGIDSKYICYLSLDAIAFNEYYIQDIVKKFRQINELRADEEVFLFLDEVTYKEHCMQEMKNLFDFGSAKVFASSSSATMLKRDTGFLTGRSRTVEVEALDFEEFLLFKGLNPRGLEKYLIEKYFLKYMELGGIPEYVLTEEAEVVIDLLSTIISKDIISFLGVKKREVIYDLFRLLCERVGKQISYNKLAKILGIHKDTVKEYVGYFVDTYLFYIAQKKGKLNERLLGSKKLYCADVGIKNVSTGFRDLGAIYENLVFLKIRKEKPFFVKKGAVEIDFWYKDNLIEAKFGQKLEGKQKEVFESFRVKKRTLAEDYKFFLDE